VLTTGVRVDRVEESRGKRYLAFVLETGFVFDDSTRDRAERAQILWRPSWSRRFRGCRTGSKCTRPTA
jgi:hypothetical protein